jgi:hypothetical protein
MSAQEKILDALSLGPLCDDCLSVSCAIFPRQQVNQRCTHLREEEHATRMKELCPRCGKKKFVNHLKPESLEKFPARQNVSAEIGSDAPVPVTEKLVRGTRIVEDQPLAAC